MRNLFLYRIVTDTNAAPNVADGYLTLTLCKQDIRKSAKVGDYVLALVAKSNEAMKVLKPRVEDEKFLAAYLFRVDQTVDMKKYDAWCSKHAPHKLCTADFFEGNAQYNEEGVQRPGPHGKAYIEKNLSGCNSLVSRYYAAWTSRSPKRLTLEEFAAMGITEEKINGLAQGYRKIPLPDTSMADSLISAAGASAAAASAAGASAAAASAAGASAAAASAAGASAAAASAAGAGPAGAGAGPAGAGPAAAAGKLFTNEQMSELEKAFHGLGGRKTRKSKKVSGKSRRVRKQDK